MNSYQSAAPMMYECRECGRQVRLWGMVGHWQVHNPPTTDRPWFKAAPRDEVSALFRHVNPNA